MPRTSFLAIDAGTRQSFEHTARLQGFLGSIWSQYGRRIDALERARRQINPRRIDSMIAARAPRRDAFGAQAGMHLARDLEHVYADVLREEFPAQNAFTLFPIDTSVAPGARTHTVRRIYQSGEVAVYRAGLDIPTVGISQQEEEFPVRHYVTSFVYDLFEALSSGYANTQLAAELLRTARDIMNEFANMRTFHGGDDMYGVLNYPWLDKKVIPHRFDSATSPDVILDELQKLEQFPAENTLNTFSPNTVVTSPRVRNFLSRRYIGDNRELSVLKKFVGESANFSRVEEARELQGIGPGGTDAILMYRRDRLGIANVITQPFTTLPVQALGFDNTTFCYMSHGGVIMRNVANNVLAYVDVEGADS